MNRKIEGSYRSGAFSGLITTIAAGTNTAGHLWAARWAPASNDARKFCVIRRLRATWVTVAGFTAAQEVQLQLFKATAFTALHNAGGAATVPSTKQRASLMPAPALAAFIANSTTAISGSTATLDTDPLASCSFSELAAAATVPKGVMALDFNPDITEGGPLVLEANEGLVLRNGILMGAVGTARVSLEFDWMEVQKYPDQFTAHRLV